MKIDVVLILLLGLHGNDVAINLGQPAQAHIDIIYQLGHDNKHPRSVLPAGSPKNSLEK